MAQKDSAEEALTTLFWYEMNEIYTSIPCVVVEVVNDFKEQRVHVQPAIDKLLKDGRTISRPPILNVPVIMPATATSAITMPINKGDVVWCMFSMRAMEVFNEGNGKPQAPNNYAKFDQKDAVAIIGLFPRKKAINNPSNRTLPHDTKDLVVAHNIGTDSEVEIRFKPNGDMIITSPAKVEVNCVDAVVNASTSASITTPDLSVSADNTTWVGDIDLTGNINQTGSQSVSGDVVASGISLASHTHNVLETNNTSTPHPTLGPNP